MTTEALRIPVNKPPRHLPRRVVVLFVLIFFAVVFAMPMLWMVSASLKPENEVLQSPPTFIPSTFQWGNYSQAGDGLLPFFLNSCKLAALNVGFLLLFASLAGYGFARLNFAFKNLAFALLLSTAMIPSMVYLVPQYMLFREMGWIDTHYPLWIPNVLTPVFGTFLLRQAFRGVPMELEEAAKLDGASTFGTFWRIMLPQVKPALAAVGALTFMGSWNDLFGPLIFLNSTRLQTMPIALALFKGEYFTQTNLMMAAATLTILPPLLLFLLAQKYFVQGITMSGLKG
ncbi:carbohydrate ABC transporter permease [Kribbella pittospori]|uniref:Carbohydrate ABC transporter permease n=2 Tax=Kribbella TaxID=182639 RepID=A0A4R0JMW5_9ACTN|nr:MULTISPECIES: carbohydrate ABC transporter permease [Kribbella]TCC47737.1 carbohydrate ABC transporter permease [Kribbella capetownensis]TCC61163.1 carbohydrate ABC transporter permease [Kribbella pittospori]